MEYLIDKINLKDFPEEIALFLRKNSIKECNNLRIFYTRLLEEINEDVKASYLNRILKYLSYDSLSIINIIEDFNEGIYDKELMQFCKNLTCAIEKCDDYLSLYESLNRKIIYVFFSKEEYLEAKKAHNENEFEKFLFILLKHTFLTYKENLPGIVSKRFYEEALTLAYNTEHRKLMMKTSADLGNVDAAILYADYIYSEDIDEAVRYFVKAKSRVSALWEIGFALEYDMIKAETRSFLLNELADCFIEDELTKEISVTEKGKSKTDEKALLMALKIYSYIIKKYDFSKAINSIGKLLIFDYISYKNNREESIKVAKKYLKRAINIGNLNAMTNLSIYFSENQNDNEYDYELIKRLFKFSADLGDIEACYYYGKILLSEESDELALKYLRYAEERNDKFACFELGKYFELKQDFQEAIKYYNKAISNYYYDAAYYLSLLYFQMNVINKDHNIEYKELSKRYLDNYMNKFTEKIKLKAQKLLENLK